MQTEISSLVMSVDLTIEAMQFAPAEEFVAGTCFCFADTSVAE